MTKQTRRRNPVIHVDGKALVEAIYEMYQEDRQERVLNGQITDNTLRHYLKRVFDITIWASAEIEKHNAIRSIKIYEKINKHIDVKDFVK